jgi:hypothetical protein
MSNPGAPVLLFGPYHPPALRKGDRMHCLVPFWTASPAAGCLSVFPLAAEYFCGIEPSGPALRLEARVR